MDTTPDIPCFFDKGLCFQCTGCGGCCTGAPGTVYVTAAEIDRLSSALNLRRADFVAEYLYPYRDSYSIREKDNYDCFLLKDGKCTVYEDRPRQCRTFPFWLKNLRSEAEWSRAARHCPGMNKGRLFSRSEILEMLSDQSSP